MQKDNLKILLESYVPALSIDYFVDLLSSNNIILKVKSDRKTKLGSAIIKIGHSPVITISRGLNPYFCAVVLAHEVAHHLAWNKSPQSRKTPHGDVWKTEYAALLNELLQSGVFPLDIANTANDFINSFFSSSKARMAFYYALESYQERDSGESLLIDLPLKTTFYYDKMKFIKSEIMLTRCVCLRTDTWPKRRYRFDLLTKVSLSA